MLYSAIDNRVLPVHLKRTVLMTSPMGNTMLNFGRFGAGWIWRRWLKFCMRFINGPLSNQKNPGKRRFEILCIFWTTLVNMSKRINAISSWHLNVLSNWLKGSPHTHRYVITSGVGTSWKVEGPGKQESADWGKTKPPVKIFFADLGSSRAGESFPALKFVIWWREKDF